MKPLAVLVPIAAACAASANAAPAMRSPLWANADRIVLACADELPCSAVLAEARRGAPFPIDVAAPGTSRERRGTMILTLAVRHDATGPVLQPQIAPGFVIDDAQGAFTPRPTPFTAADAAARHAAIAAALDSALPWRTPSRTKPTQKRFVIHKVQ